ncbi:vacuolar segregation subunit 7-domain-containing protein [Paraphoma chrysanthemicola]|uniref:Vacuolar segregation subunit 7-domain-containing protein n=1 Tax=Paraphoma chrysanthemicola TaxID=798071 RepID=A0A8K0RET9_9PLEO|nr:vacuolar segregation subunit 7-domain-containing protein [Paraphoma chrysanthemicola]
MTSASDAGFQSITGALESAEPTPEPTPTPQAPAPAPPPTTASKGRRKSAAGSENASAAPMKHQTTLAGTRALNVSGTPSPKSPLSSRDASPARPLQRTTAPPSTTAARSGIPSRKNSADASPNRGPSLASSSNSPSAAAIQRALSSTSIPQLQPSSSTDAIKAPRPTKGASGSNSGDNTPHWPISPRLRSPPPPGSDGRSSSRSRANSLRNQIRKPEAQSTPAIVVQSSSPASQSRIPVREEAPGSDPEEPPLSMKAPSRGASGVAPKLETVQESSLPATPGFDGLEVDSFISSSTTTHKNSDEERNDVSSSKVTEDLSSKNSSTRNTGSGSDSGPKTAKKGKMQEQRSASTQRPHHVTSKPSLSSLSTRSASQQPSRNMTVETETVPSVAQSTIGNADRAASGRVDGSLRLKPSNETIRPKKERKPAKRKAPSITAGTGRSSQLSYHYIVPSRPDVGPRSNTASSIGSPVSYISYDDRRSTVTMSPPSPEMRMLEQRPSLRYFYSSTNTSFRKASSKADVFEQKVASAVDEADSSDSDATFIYESAANDHQQPHRSRHHHSRTPSITSITTTTSLVDPRLAIRDAHKNPGKKNSMKFTNPYSNAGADPDALDRGDGTMRIGSGRAGAGSHHHHVARHGQGRGALGHLVLDSDSSLAQSSRARGPSSRQASQPNSPRFQPFTVGNGHSNGSKKYGEYSTYDMDADHAADDERTPLITSGRSPRVRTPRRRNSLSIRVDRRHHNGGGWCRRFAACLVLSILLLVLIFCAIGLIFATTKPLTSVKVQAIQNVVASQDEIMLDMIVDAVNPNIITVTVADMDVTIFAKSKHVGSDKWWRHHGSGPPDNEEEWKPVDDDIAIDGVDEGTDPIEGEPRTMSLGHIFQFNSPLTYEGSFFARKRASSIGEIRLSHPGNKTEAGGTERWEEVLQYPFELIVRGNFKYSLPLSTTEHKVPVTASYYYDPDAEKKKLKAADHTTLSKEEQRKQTPQPVTLKAPGRYDRRAILPTIVIS